KIRLGTSYVNTTTNQWLPAQDSVTLNVHRDNGFLRIAPITGTNSMILQQFKVNENGEIQSLAETYINYTALPIDTVATMDGGYAVIYPDHTPPSTSIPFASYMSIRGFFLQNGESEKQGPFVLYQTQNQISNIILLDCDFTKVGFGQTCILVLNIAPAIDQNTFIKIDFLSTGTVYNITIFQNPADLADFSIQSLPYGGYLLYSTVNNQNDPTTLNLYGYILDDRSNRYDWNISYPTLTNFNGDILILPNNTLAIPQPEIDQIWGLFTTDLYKIEGAHDHGYGNLHILNTIPKIGENIDPSKITSLIIQFYSKVDLSSNRKITILQDGGIIRQTTSISNNNGDFVKFIDDYTIEIKVINSTFNQPNTKYYVLIDDGFVKSKDLQEPIPGIQDNAWNFMTIQQEANNGILDIYKNQVNASNIKGKIRLTAEGTTYFKTSDLNTLIRNKLITVIGTGEYTNYLDEEYGYETIRFAFKVVIDELMRHDLRKLLEKVRKLKDDLKEDNNSTVKEGNNSTVEEGNNFTVKEDNISTIKEDNISIIEEDNGSTIEESNSSTAKEDNNSTVEDKSKKDNTNEVVDREEKVKELKKVLRDTRKELRKIKGELTEVSNLMKELKVVNELIEKLENPTSTNNVNLTPTNNVNPTPTNNVNPTPTNNVNPIPTNNVNLTPTNNVKDILKKLRGINDLIEKLMQVEDFTEDLIEVCINLNELDKLLNGINELKEVVVHEESRGVNMEESNEINREEPKEVTKFTDELNKIRKLMEGLNEIEKLKGQLNKAVDLMNRLKKKEPMSQNEHTTSENELTTSENKLIINELEKLERFKKELEILESFKRDSVEKLEDQNNMTNVNRNSVWEEVKRWSNIFSNKFISFQKKYEKKAMKVIEGDQPAEKKYRKISKWLRDYKDNQIIVIIFTILAGVDISHLELLGSNLRIKIPSFSFRGLEIRNIDVNFNAELSHAAKHSLFWGDVTNIFIEDISAIIIQ
ncbi:4356_t:CDS:2, partial [Rhizophagus irregularis]